MVFIPAMSVLLFFIDGLGIGTRGPHNPLDGLADAEPLAIFQTKRRPFQTTASLFPPIHVSA